MDLFDYMRTATQERESPLASRMRPRTLDEVAGQKHIILHIKGIENQKDVEVDTDCETLAEALNEQKDLQVKIDEGPYGAYLVSLIGETAAKDQGWVYESPNNEVCLSMEYCPALEQVMIQDQDEFIFSLIGGFE